MFFDYFLSRNLLNNLILKNDFSVLNVDVHSDALFLSALCLFPYHPALSSELSLKSLWGCKIPPAQTEEKEKPMKL